MINGLLKVFLRIIHCPSPPLEECFTAVTPRVDELSPLFERSQLVFSGVKSVHTVVRALVYHTGVPRFESFRVRKRKEPAFVHALH